jgi:hypothetical protein
MHYRDPYTYQEMDNVDKFLHEMGLTEAMPQPKINVTKSTLPLTAGYRTECLGVIKSRWLSVLGRSSFGYQLRIQGNRL